MQLSCEGDSTKQPPGCGLFRVVYTEQSGCARNDNFFAYTIFAYTNRTIGDICAICGFTFFE